MSNMKDLSESNYQDNCMILMFRIAVFCSHDLVNRMSNCLFIVFKNVFSMPISSSFYSNKVYSIYTPSYHL